MANLNNHNIPNRGCLHSKRGSDTCSIGAAGEKITRDSKGFKTKGAIKNAVKKIKQIRSKPEKKGFA
jgi:hypothetical protein